MEQSLFRFEPEAPFDRSTNLSTRQVTGPSFTTTRTPQGAPRESVVEDAGEQFDLFAASTSSDAEAVRELHELTPELDCAKGSDVEAQVTLMGVQIGRKIDQRDENRRATLRLVMGTDPASQSSLVNTGFWALAAGLKLYKDMKENASTTPNAYAFETREAFNRRPIQVAGGLATFSFQIVEHEEPPWYQRIFDFARSDQARKLVAAVGLPGVTLSAVTLLDELLQRLDAHSPKPMFQSRPLRLALTKDAKDDLSLGSSRVRVGVLNRGWYILARRQDFAKLRADDAMIDASGKLVPKKSAPGEINNPFDQLNYALLHIKLKSTSLSERF